MQQIERHHRVAGVALVVGALNVPIEAVEAIESQRGPRRDLLVPLFKRRKPRGRVEGGVWMRCVPPTERHEVGSRQPLLLERRRHVRHALSQTPQRRERE
eukprot:6740393-Prymnesium_polylepis.1